ncbi:gastrula zinc finger protein XlCGF28.1-like [Silurus meridionalis]|nr:gastrula zinc finger protein XlCGF28.1-like [Silurus meridionalis]
MEKEKFWSELDEVVEGVPKKERLVIGADFNGHVGEGNRVDEEVMVVEFVTIRCRPFYLPREFTTVYIVGVYIPLSANAKEALSELYGAISDLQNAHPDGLFIIAGDFNHANLKTVLPKLHQHVDFATRGANTLDLVYTNIPGAYRAEPRPHLGYSDHCSVMLIPAYRPLIRRSKPVLKQVKTWPEEATSALQDCFECTDWDMFREAATNGDSINLKEYTSVTSNISKCVDDVTISKTITTRSNQKPWMTANVRVLLKHRDSAFRSGDKAALKTARAKLSRAIREAKHAHAKKIHNHFQDSGDTRRMWQGIQAITNYKTTSPACDHDASLPDALNDFYPPAEVRKTLSRVNPRKSAGPDNIPGRVLRECAEQLADVFTDIFNISLSSNVVPTCLTTTTIVPVPKKSTVSCLNDYRPVALTTFVMKCFERLVMRHINTQLPPSLDPMQFAYHPNSPNREVEPTGPEHLPLQLDPGLPDWETPVSLVGLISKNDESAYREEERTEHRSSVEIVKSTKFLGVHLADNLTWSLNTSSMTKKAQQRLYFLRRLRKTHLPPPILSMFYRGTIESILSSCITAWFGNCTVSDRKTLQRIVRTAEKIIRVSLPSIMDIYITRCIRKAHSIVDDHTHPSHTLFTLLLSGKRHKPPLFLIPGGSIFSIYLPIYPISLLCTCPNHLNLTSLTLSPKCPKCAVPLINYFLILSILVTPHANLKIFSSATSSSTSRLLLNATVSNLYNIAGLTTVL